MKRFILMIISSFAVLFVTAQEEIIFDSIPNKQPEINELNSVMGEPSFLNETLCTQDFNLFENFQFKQPLLPDYNKNLDFGKYLNDLKGTQYNFFNTESFFNPIFPAGLVFSQGSYQMNKRFLIGGNSFGARSVFDPPKLNSTIQNMSIKGASMFLQYKVSDNFKIETRVSIYNHPSSPLLP